jgi:hypothetical protein
MNKSSPKSTTKSDMGHKVFFTAVAVFFFLLLLTLVYVYIDASNIDKKKMSVSMTDKKKDTSASTKVVTGKFDDLRFDFDRNKYEVNKSLVDGVTFYSIYANTTEPSEQKEMVLEIKDATTLPEYTANSKYVELFPVIGMEEGSTLRDVTILGKRYSFERENFSEGYPTGEEGCYSGGGYQGDYLLTSNGLAISISNPYTTEGCADKGETNTYTFNDATIEAALKMVESIRYEK